MAEDMLSALERNCRQHGIRLLNIDSGQQGSSTSSGPSSGLTQPG
jgi:3-isopropylmalate dehydratase large subunit